MRTAIWIANAALLVLCCFLAGGIVSEIAAAVLIPAPADVAAPAPTARATARGWDERKPILERNLFNASKLAPSAPVDEDEELAKTKLPLELLGTAAAGDPSLSWAAVQDLDTREHLVVRVGTDLKGRAKVERIERRRIVLRNGGRLEELSLDEDQVKGSTRKTASRSTRGSLSRARPRPNVTGGNSPADRVRRLAENRFAVDRDEVESVANNPASLFSQARILPKYEEGEMVGVQLNAIKPGSLFEQIGIENGDTIKEFNGIQIESQQDSAQVLRELTEASDFNVTVRGADGEERQLSYQLE